MVVPHSGCMARAVSNMLKSLSIEQKKYCILSVMLNPGLVSKST